MFLLSFRFIYYLGKRYLEDYLRLVLFLIRRKEEGDGYISIIGSLLLFDIFIFFRWWKKCSLSVGK